LPVVRFKQALTVVVLVLAVAFILLRLWQGPEVPGYRIEPMPLVQTVVATGRVVSVSRALIGSELTGVVLERRVQEGDKVIPGNVLLVLREDDIPAQIRQLEAALDQLENTTRPQAKVALTRAEVELDQAIRETERRRSLADRSSLSAEALEQAEQQETLARNAVETARLALSALATGSTEETRLREQLASLQAKLARTVIRAEVAGTVLTRNVEPGDLVQPGRVLFTIALSGDTEIRVPLDEKNLSLLSLEQNASIIADAYPDKPFPASISFIAPAVDPTRGTVDVRLTVDPVPDFLLQDMTVSVNIETGRRDRALAIPNDALIALQGNSAQVLALRGGKVQRTAVTLGLRGLAMSEVLSGLQAGDTVLADVTTALADGTRVRITEQAPPVSATSSGPATPDDLPVNLN
jgi:HlyD family secretion protein